MALAFTDDEARMSRVRAQRLDGGRARDHVDVVRSMVGIQAQDMPAARLALRARTVGITATDVVRSHDEDRALVRIWAMRGTLHMVAAEDVAWLVGLLGPVFAAADRRRRKELGLDDALLGRAMPALREILADRGPLTRAELVEHLGAHGVSLDSGSQGPAHLIGYAAMTGIICRGPDVDKGEPTYVLVGDWAGQQRELDGEEALAELTRRYVASRGPVSSADFRRWSGLPARRARLGFELTADELTEVEVTDEPAFVIAGTRRSRRRKEPAVELLGMFDEYLLSYASRDVVLDPAFAKRIQSGGLVKPALLLDGRVVGSWRKQRTRTGLTLTVEPFEKVTAIEPQIEAVARDIGRFLETDVELRVAPPAHP